MTYEEYIQGYDFQFKPGDVVTEDFTGETLTIQLVRKSFRGLDIWGRCNNGRLKIVGHDAIRPLLSPEERTKFCLASPYTTVTVEHDHTSNKYAVVVSSCDHFQLGTFDTEQQALDYIQQKNLAIRTWRLECIEP